jgi:hypothetical protein
MLVCGSGSAANAKIIRTDGSEAVSQGKPSAGEIRRLIRRDSFDTSTSTGAGRP